MFKAFLSKYLYVLALGIVFVLCIYFQYVPLRSLLVDGPFSWHVGTPQFVQGGIELLVFFGLMFGLAVFFKNRVVLSIILVFALLYLRLHQVLVPALVALLYFEIIISIGWCVIRLFSQVRAVQGYKDGEIQMYLDSFFVGFVVWAVFALVISLFGYGQFVHMRILTVLLGGVSLFGGVKKPMSFYFFDRFVCVSRFEKILSLFLFVLVLALFAKANVAFDSDSLFYGLRPENVLVGEHSFFDNLGLISTVHFYPKLFELFLLPISNLGDYSFILVCNVFVLILLFSLIFSFLRELALNRVLSLFGVVLIGTIPVVANYGVTAKPDLFVTFLIIYGALNFWNWLKNSDCKYLFIGLSAMVLSLGVKFVSFAYIPFLLVGVLAAYVVMHGFRILRSKVFDFYFYFWVFLMALLVLTGICYRTYVLTGYPFWFLMNLWNFLGFTVKYPLPNYSIATFDGVFSFNYFGSGGNLSHLYNVFFRPAEFKHLLVTWFGNLPVFLSIVGFLFVFFKKVNFKKNVLNFLFFTPIILIGVNYILFFSFGKNVGGDGNYFFIPIIISIILLYPFVVNVEKKLQVFVLFFLSIFIISQTFIMFLTHLSYKTGTSEFNLDLLKPIIDSPIFDRRVFKRKGLLPLEDYLDDVGGSKRTVFLNNGFVQRSFLYRLSGTLDLYEHLDLKAEDSETSVVDLLDYFSWAKIDYFVYPKEVQVLELTNVQNKLIGGFDNCDDLSRLELGDFYLYDISQIRNDFEGLCHPTYSQ